MRALPLFFGLLGVAVGACGSTGISSNGDSALFFTMYYHAADDGPMLAAVRAARAEPALGIAYAFPLVSEGLDVGTSVELVAGRYGGLYVEGAPVIENETLIGKTTLGPDGTAAFAPPSVDTPSRADGVTGVPSELLRCGSTVFVARAWRPKMGAEGRVVVASAFFTLVSETCAPSP